MSVVLFNHKRSACLLILCFAACLPAFGQNVISESAARQMRALLAEKATRNPAQRKLDSHIHYAAKIRRGQSMADGIPSLPTVASSLETGRDGLVHVDIRAQVNPGLLSAIAALGGKVESSFADYDAIRAWLPLLAAETLAARPDVQFIRPAARARTNAGPDVAGVIAHAANVVQAGGNTGSGVKIGVLSDGVNSLASQQSAGNLPTTVTVLSSQAGNGDEGTAMLEIVYSMAPGAHLYFATANGGEAQFAANIQALAAAGCKIIVDDVSYLDEPAFQDGIVAKAVNTVTASGVLYFSSAANSGNLDSGTSGTWEGDFVSAGNSPIQGEPGLVHSFGGLNNDTITHTSSAGFYSLQWSDPFGASCNDYDFFIIDPAMTRVLDASTSIQSCTQDPFEAVSDDSTAVPAGSHIMIVNYQGVAAPRAFHVDTERGQLSIATAGATFGHNAAAAAITVAATDVANAHGGAFTGGHANPAEYFSSDGPRTIFYSPTGSPITANNFLFSTHGGTTLAKVDITAADGVPTGVAGFAPFYGTSAAAPHAAAIAALVLSAHPSMTPAQIKTAMLSTALPVLGYNARTVGSGIVMANLSVGSGGHPPAVTTGSASAIAFTSATLGGTVNPNGADTHVWFLYSGNSSMSGGISTSQQDIGSGSSVLPFSANITGLTANTTYYFQAWASNAGGTSKGSIVSFFTGIQLGSALMTRSAPNQCATPPASTSFLQADVSGWLWFNVSNAAAGDQSRADWYSPSASLYRSDSWTPLGWSGSGCLWDRLDIAGKALQPGAWSVKLYWNNSLFFTLGFTIRSSTAPSLVWMNKTSRAVTINYYGGAGGAVLQGWNWLINPGPPGWSVVAAADFDRNGTPDLVWMNDTTRQVTVHYYGGPMGAVDKGWAWLNSTGAPGWTVVGAADMDGNGVPDLIWQNDATRQVTVNYYGGTGGSTYLGWNYLNSKGAPGWTVVGVADFDRNGVPDLVWQNQTTRQVTVNYYGGTGGATNIGWNWLKNANVPGWTVVGANDFDGNGVPDLVWQNDSTSQVTVNYYGGTGGATYTGWNWLNQANNAAWRALVAH